MSYKQLTITFQSTAKTKEVKVHMTIALYVLATSLRELTLCTHSRLYRDVEL